MTPADSSRSAPNERGFTRVGVAFGVTVVPTEGGQTIHAQLRNVSVSGVMLECPPDAPLPAPASTCRITVSLGDSDEHLIEATARVVRSGPEGLALQIEQVEGETSFEHLRNLVLYNAPDADRVEDEIQDHLGLRPKE